MKLYPAGLFASLSECWGVVTAESQLASVTWNYNITSSITQLTIEMIGVTINSLRTRFKQKKFKLHTTVVSCCFMYPFSQTSWETCFCSLSFSSINSLFIAESFRFTLCSLDASFLCLSRHLNRTKNQSAKLISDNNHSQENRDRANGHSHQNYQTDSEEPFWKNKKKNRRLCRRITNQIL